MWFHTLNKIKSDIVLRWLLAISMEWNGNCVSMGGVSSKTAKATTGKGIAWEELGR